MIDDDRRLPSGAFHRPSLVRVVVALMNVEMQLDVPEVIRLGERPRRRIQVRIKLAGILLVEPHEAAVKRFKLVKRNLLERRVHRIAAHDFEVLAVGVGLRHHLQA